MGRRPKVNREGVLAAAREAFAERGFEATTLAAIAARLDLSPAALLRHAASKEELFAACMAPGPSDLRLPVDFLAELDGSEDPRGVLLRIGREFIPFIEHKLDEQVARFMRAKAGERAFPFPFAGQPRPTPPQRGFAVLEDYFRRAAGAGSLRVSDPSAAALAFLGSLHSYVVLKRMLQVPDPEIPLERYLSTVLEVWTHGGIAQAPEAGQARLAEGPPGEAVAALQAPAGRAPQTSQTLFPAAPEVPGQTAGAGGAHDARTLTKGREGGARGSSRQMKGEFGGTKP